MKVIDSGNESLMKFPHDFQLKAMGLNESGFETLVVDVVRRHLEEDAEIESSSVTSRGDKYRSVTVRFMANSRTQLDSIYMDLTDEPAVLVAL